MRSKQFGVFDKTTGELVEGGFFSRYAAEDAADTWQRETGRAYVVQAQS